MFVQIGDENVITLCELLDEVFGSRRTARQISFRQEDERLSGRLLEENCGLYPLVREDMEQ